MKLNPRDDLSLADWMGLSTFPPPPAPRLHPKNALPVHMSAGVLPHKSMVAPDDSADSLPRKSDVKVGRRYSTPSRTYEFERLFV